jgi:hypothetical protein
MRQPGVCVLQHPLFGYRVVSDSSVDTDDLLGYCGQIRSSDTERVAKWAEHHARAGDECCLASGAVVMPVLRGGVQVQSEVLVRPGGAVRRC